MSKQPDCICCEKLPKPLPEGMWEHKDDIELVDVDHLGKILVAGDLVGVQMWAEDPSMAKYMAPECQYVKGVDWKQVAAEAVAFWDDEGSHPEPWNGNTISEALRLRTQGHLNEKDQEALISVFLEMIQFIPNGNFENGRHRVAALVFAGAKKIPVVKN